MLVENELTKLERFDSSYFRGKNYSAGHNGTQNYLVFQRMNKYYKNVGNTGKISSWKSKGLVDEIIKPIDNTQAPELIYSGETIHVKFDENYLKQDKITFNHGKIVNIYIVYETTKNNPISDSYPVIQNSLFGEIAVNKNKTIEELQFTGYGT